MSIINLDELYVEYYYSEYCEPYECYGFEINTDYAKPLRELIQEYLDLEVVDDETYFANRGNWEWNNDIISPDEHKYLQKIMDGEITEYTSDDRGKLPGIWVCTNGMYEDKEHHLTPLKEAVKYNKSIKSEWARKEGIRPRECWYREELDDLYNDLPF